ncbi:MAG TPA: hypothetical protein VF395_09660, partial [Polyangiaceae bacterium]
MELDDETVRRLAVLGDPIEVLARLASSVAEGVRRPGRLHRDQTDESLRVERHKTDVAIAKDHEIVEGDADEVVRVARQRADEIVRSARGDADRERRPQSMAGEASSERDRIRADTLLED